MVTAGWPPFQKVKSSEQLDRLKTVAHVCGEEVPSALAFALLVVGESFVGIVVIEIDVAVCVVRVDFDTGIKQERVGEFTACEKAYGHGIVVMRFRIAEIRDSKRIQKLDVDVQLLGMRRIGKGDVVWHVDRMRRAGECGSKDNAKDRRGLLPQLHY